MEFDGPLLKERYRLGPRLGRGAQALTRLARDEVDDRVVVVKQLRLADGGGWKRFDLFEREVRTLQALDHPGIPRFVDSFESEPGTFNLVMQRAPGATLWAYAQKGRLDEALVRDVLVQALGILRYLHGRSPPVIHRDLKPGNLVRAADGRLALVDFGGVRDAARPEGGSTVIGTFGYMAPEQLHGEATPATDLYALGATIVALAGGVEPERVPRQGLRMDLARHLPTMDPSLREVLEGMTEPDPAARPASAQAVLARLITTTAARRAGRTSGPIPATTPRPPSTSMLAPAVRTPVAIERALDDVAAFGAELPGPLRLVFRVVVAAIAMGGYLGVLFARVALLPIAYAIASAIVSDRHRPRALQIHDDVEEGMARAQKGLRALARGKRKRAELGPAR